MSQRTLTKFFAPMFLAGILVGAASTTLGATMLGSARFTDVPAGSYFDGAVGRLVDQGVIKGFPDGTFKPEQQVTRADVAVMIDRAINGAEETGSTTSRASRSKSSSSAAQVTTGESTSGAGNFIFTAANFNVSEAAKELKISVLRTGGDLGQVSVEYAVGGGTATYGTDYSTNGGTLHFAGGETSKLLTINLADDVVGEANETLTVTLANPQGGAGLGAQKTTAVTILDNDGGAGAGASSAGMTTSAGPAGAFVFSALTYGVDENGGSVPITVRRIGGTSGAVDVGYATTNGTGQAGTHYSTTQGTLSFAAGETSKTFSVHVNDNATIDGNKTVNLTLMNPTGGAVLGSPSTAVLTVVDTDAVATGSGVIQFSAATYTVTESAGSATITVLRQAGSVGTVNVNYSTYDGTAVNGADYTATSGTMTFTTGETSKSFAIPILKDSLAESDETVNLTLTNLSGPASLGTQNNATLKIVGN